MYLGLQFWAYFKALTGLLQMVWVDRPWVSVFPRISGSFEFFDDPQIFFETYRYLHVDFYFHFELLKPLEIPLSCHLILLFHMIPPIWPSHQIRILWIHGIYDIYWKPTISYHIKKTPLVYHHSSYIVFFYFFHLHLFLWLSKHHRFASLQRTQPALRPVAPPCGSCSVGLEPSCEHRGTTGRFVATIFRCCRTSCVESFCPLSRLWSHFFVSLCSKPADLVNKNPWSTPWKKNVTCARSDAPKSPNIHSLSFFQARIHQRGAYGRRPWDSKSWLISYGFACTFPFPTRLLVGFLLGTGVFPVTFSIQNISFRCDTAFHEAKDWNETLGGLYLFVGSLRISVCNIELFEVKSSGTVFHGWVSIFPFNGWLLHFFPVGTSLDDFWSHGPHLDSNHQAGTSSMTCSGEQSKSVECGALLEKHKGNRAKGPNGFSEHFFCFVWKWKAGWLIMWDEF